MSYTDDHCRAGFMPNDADCPCKLCEMTREMGRKCGEAFARNVANTMAKVLSEHERITPCADTEAKD